MLTGRNPPARLADRDVFVPRLPGRRRRIEPAEDHDGRSSHCGGTVVQTALGPDVERGQAEDRERVPEARRLDRVGEAQRGRYGWGNKLDAPETPFPSER